MGGQAFCPIDVSTIARALGQIKNTLSALAYFRSLLSLRQFEVRQTAPIPRTSVARCEERDLIRSVADRCWSQRKRLRRTPTGEP